MKRLLTILLASTLWSTCALQPAFGAVGDTLQYRAFHAPVWCFRTLDNSNYGQPAWNIAWGGATHVVVFCNGNLITSAPYFTGLSGGSDSLEMHYGPTGGTVHYLDSLIAIAHRNGVRVTMTIQAVNPSNWDNIIADSTKTQIFFNNFIPWLFRKGFDGWDLNYEGGSPNLANFRRGIRVGRRTSYNAVWQTYLDAIGKTGFPQGRAVITGSFPVGSQTWFDTATDSMMTYYAVETSSYFYVWNGSANVDYYQTGVYPEFQAAHPSWNISALSRDWSTGKNIVQLWVDAGRPRSKVVIGCGSSIVAGAIGTDTILTTYSGTFLDAQLYDAERMTSFGGHRTYSGFARSPKISGTATSGNPLGLSAGQKFWMSFSDSDNIKAAAYFADSVGAGGIWVYDQKGDMRPIGQPNNHAIDWQRTPSIYAGLYYASLLHNSITPTVVIPSVSIVSVTPTSDGAQIVINVTSDGNGTLTEVGIVYGTSIPPTIADNKITTTASTGLHTVTVTGLAPNTFEYTRGYAINSAGVGYSSLSNFTTTLTVGTVSTSIAQVCQTKITVNGNLTSLGGSPVDSVAIIGFRGATTPTITSFQFNYRIARTGLGVFSNQFTSLKGDTTYTWRAAAHNSFGWFYGTAMTQVNRSCPLENCDMPFTGYNINIIIEQQGGLVTHSDFFTVTVYGDSTVKVRIPTWLSPPDSQRVYSIAEVNSSLPDTQTVVMRNRIGKKFSVLFGKP